MVKKDSFIKGQEEKENLNLIMNSIENLPKEIADYVTDDIDKDGIYNACVHLGLIK